MKQSATRFDVSPVLKASAGVMRAVRPGTSANGVAKPILKWVGGKGQLLSQLRTFYPPRYEAYFEPFLGGGALYFDLKPAKASLNDVNAALMGCYRNIQKRSDEIIEMLRRLQTRYEKSTEQERAEMFYKIRSEYNTLADHIPQKTAFLIFLNKTCYNGMYRENSTGQFNVPFGRYTNPQILDEENVRNVSIMLDGATLSSVSFEQAVRSAKRNDFVYFDPPYHPLNQTSNFTGYHAQDFTETDQKNLRDLVVDLDKRGCLVMLSNSYSDFIRDLYRDFYQHAVLASRAINCKATGRGKIKELLVTNYEI
jgi:DNA adenine methylase